jgi:ribosomal protein S18 acetylase RimI-like enzyme
VKLQKVPLTEATFKNADMKRKIDAFDCGNKVWETEISDALKSGQVLGQIHERRDVWLYLTPARELAGYAGLVQSEIVWIEDIGLKRTYLEVSPIGVDKQFWGRKNVPREERCSYQIMGDLIEEARRRRIAPLLFLFVHPCNWRAINFYQNAGFRQMVIQRYNPRLGNPYRGMSLKL